MRDPVTTQAELATLDSNEIVEGYRDGKAGEPEPGDNRSKSYCHGWRNGQNDRAGTSDAAQIQLIQDCKRVHGSDITKWGDPA